MVYRHRGAFSQWSIGTTVSLVNWLSAPRLREVQRLGIQKHQFNLSHSLSDQVVTYRLVKVPIPNDH
jgi:hypothetical protein